MFIDPLTQLNANTRDNGIVIKLYFCPDNRIFAVQFLLKENDGETMVKVTETNGKSNCIPR